MVSPDQSREHLANERTFLAWIRTSIGVMAFGFVVVRFSLFLKQLGYLLQKAPLTPSKGYSSVLGIVLVAFGVLIAFLAFLRYRRIEKQLQQHAFETDGRLPFFLLAFLLLTGALLILYLLHSI